MQGNGAPAHDAMWWRLFGAHERKLEPERARPFLVDGEVYEYGSDAMSSASLGPVGCVVFSGDAAAALLQDPGLRHS